MDENYIELEEAYLEHYWNKFFGSINEAEALFAKRAFINAAKELISDKDAEKLLYLKTKGFKVKIKMPMLKYVVLTPFLASFLQYLGTTHIPIVLLANILPSLIDIEQVEINHEEDEIRLSLPLLKHNGNYRSAEKWYADLSEELRNQISLGKFKDLMDKLVFAGLAKQDEKEKFMIFKKGKRTFKVSFS